MEEFEQAIIELVSQGYTEDEAKKITSILWKLYQGSSVYFNNKPLQQIKTENILKEFNGSNHKQLARKYKCSQTHIYNIIKKSQSKKQLKFNI